MSKFTRKHYRAVAEAIRETRIEQECSFRDCTNIGRVQEQLARMFARDNGNFDRSIFDRACEPDGAIYSRKAARVVPAYEYNGKAAPCAR